MGSASKGELNALLADLGQRMHWAMGGESDDRYPAAAPREVTFEAGFPPGAGEAAEAFRAEAVTLGGRSASVDRSAREPAPAPVDRYSPAPAPVDRSGPARGHSVAVVFSELPPDPAFRDREAQLVDLAARHGGEYRGYHGGAAEQG